MPTKNKTPQKKKKKKKKVLCGIIIILINGHERHYARNCFGFLRTGTGGLFMRGKIRPVPAKNLLAR
jgi:hypothetical protein